MPRLHRIGINHSRNGIGGVMKSIDELKGTDTKQAEQKQNRITEIESKHWLTFT
jgi:hypothetical protein